MRTVHLTGRFAPGGRDWHQGTITLTPHYVIVENPYGRSVYPLDKVERID